MILADRECRRARRNPQGAIVRRLAQTGIVISAVAALIAICGLGLACDPPTSERDGHVSIRVLTQPQGGNNVSRVTCVFEVTVAKSGGSSGPLGFPVTLNASWHSPYGSYGMSSQTFSVAGKVDTITTSRSAPSGTYLNEDLWLDLRWSDADGTHNVISDTASCRLN